MTFRELADDCWRDLPPFRRVIAGRGNVHRLLGDAVREFDPDRVGFDGYDAELLEAVKRRNSVGDGEGFAVLTFILVTVAAAVISWLIQRWLDNHFPKPQLEAWKQELAA